MPSRNRSSRSKGVFGCRISSISWKWPKRLRRRRCTSRPTAASWCATAMRRARNARRRARSTRCSLPTTCFLSTPRRAWPAGLAPRRAPPKRSSPCSRSTTTWRPRWPPAWWLPAAQLCSRARASRRSTWAIRRSTPRCRALRAWRRACFWAWPRAMCATSCWWTARAPRASSARTSPASMRWWPRRTTSSRRRARISA